MGLDNRDHVHDESGYDGFGGGGPAAPGPAGWSPVGKLIGATCVVYVLSCLIPEVAANLTLSWDGVSSGKVWQVLTYGFTDYGVYDAGGVARNTGGGMILWFAVSMFVTYQFGRMLGRVLPQREIVLLCLVSVIIGGLVALATPARNLGVANVYLYGSVVLLWTAMAFPDEKILLFFILPVELWLVAGFMVVMVVVGLLSPSWPLALSTAAALAFAAFHQKTGLRLSRVTEQFADWRAERSRPKLRVVRAEPEEDADFDRQVDAVLEKLGREGEASLSVKERKLLKQASKRYKDRV